jgi:hypothetical protein
MTALRWLVTLPAAAAAGYVAWFLVRLLNRATFFFQGLDPDSLLSRAFIEAVSNGMLGAAFVYAGAKAAPSHKRAVVFVLAGLIVLAGGFALFPAILARSGWAIYAAAWLVVGACGVAWSVYSGELTEDQLR